MILWEKSDCSPDWTELLSILADLAKLTEKCSKNCGLLPISQVTDSPMYMVARVGYESPSRAEPELPSQEFYLRLFFNNKWIY